MPVSLCSVPSILKRSCLHANDLEIENVWLILLIVSICKSWLSYKRHRCKHTAGASV